MLAASVTPLFLPFPLVVEGTQSILPQTLFALDWAAFCSIGPLTDKACCHEKVLDGGAFAETKLFDSLGFSGAYKRMWLAAILTA